MHQEFNSVEQTFQEVGYSQDKKKILVVFLTKRLRDKLFQTEEEEVIPLFKMCI